MKPTLLQKFLITSLLISLIPIIGLTVITTHKGKDAISDEVKKGLVIRASEIGARVSYLLNSVTNDLDLLRTLPRNSTEYLNFSNAKVSSIWTRVGTNTDSREVSVQTPIYKEISFIDNNGIEQVKVSSFLNQGLIKQGRYDVETMVAGKSELKDVSRPENTLFKAEDYFLKASKLPQDEIYIGHLMGWYVSSRDQLGTVKIPEEAIEGKRYEGIIRFAAPVYDQAGKLNGVVSLALDHAHLQEMILHTEPLQREPVIFSKYSTGNYAFLFDDEGWIIAHPKLWDIKGLNDAGETYEPFTNIDGTNKGPVNLVRGPINDAHYKLKQLLSDILENKPGVFDVINLGLDSQRPVIRAQAYAPIALKLGGNQDKIFGGVMVGANLKSVDEIAQKFYHISYLLLLITVPIVAATAFFSARSIAKPVNRLARAAADIANGNLDCKLPPLGGDEIGRLGEAFNGMVINLKDNIGKLERSHKEQLELKNQLAEKEKKEKLNLKSRVDELEKELASTPHSGIVYKSAVMRELMARLWQVAQTDATVLISGERGTGKEKAAEAIHNLSKRKDAPYLRINCAAISESLIESELFGHARGSFTGAYHDKAGFFEAAKGGTLLLDEIGEILPPLQAKLLRVLQERKITRVGETKEREINTRLIFSTNKDLREQVASGKFRADLFDRLNVISIDVPPLRIRKDDIMPLARHFLNEANIKYDKSIIGFTDDAATFLVSYDWPGNIRELANAIERADIQTLNNIIDKDDIKITDMTTTIGSVILPDMSIEELKVNYSKHIRNKYPDRPLKFIKDILKIDWNTLRKYLSM